MELLVVLSLLLVISATSPFFGRDTRTAEVRRGYRPLH